MKDITKEALLAAEPKFLDLFGSAEQVATEFHMSEVEQQRYTILYASYEYACYSGDAIVFGYDTVDDTFFQVSGGHCSCYGLEGQWSPEPLTVEEIAEFVRRGVGDFVAWVSE